MRVCAISKHAAPNDGTHASAYSKDQAPAGELWAVQTVSRTAANHTMSALASCSESACIKYSHSTIAVPSCFPPPRPFLAQRTAGCLLSLLPS
jgi:hypothetical protein